MTLIFCADGGIVEKIPTHAVKKTMNAQKSLVFQGKPYHYLSGALPSLCSLMALLLTVNLTEKKATRGSPGLPLSVLFPYKTQLPVGLYSLVRFQKQGNVLENQHKTQDVYHLTGEGPQRLNSPRNMFGVTISIFGQVYS